MKRRIIILSIFLIFVFAVWQRTSAVSSAAPTSEESGRVTGVVLDPNDARVWRALVTIKAKDFERRVETGTAGEFEAELPVAKGPYYFTVQANGFCTFEGESLRARPNITEVINVHLEVQAMDNPDACKCSSRKARKQ